MNHNFSLAILMLVPGSIVDAQTAENRNLTRDSFESKRSCPLEAASYTVVIHCKPPQKNINN